MYLPRRLSSDETEHNIEEDEEEIKKDFYLSNERYYFGPGRILTKRISLKSNDGTLDFTITGGNNLQPIQVASVVWASQAYLQGMRPGDQIISVNEISFQDNIDYTKALQVCILFVYLFANLRFFLNIN